MVVAAALGLAWVSCASTPDPPAVAEPAAVPDLPEVQVEPEPEIDEKSGHLQLSDKGGLVVVQSGFQSFEGDRCIISLDSAGNLVTSVSLHSGHSCPYEEGHWKVDPVKVKELVQMMNAAGAVLEPSAPHPDAGKHMGPSSEVQTDQGSYQVVPGGKVDPVGDYLHELYENR
jgi:hypothetical protein